MSSRSHSPMRGYRQRKDAARKSVLDSYYIMGFLASGTYGRVYKAKAKRDKDGEPTSDGALAAIKKFKPDKDGEQLAYTGISQSACREIMLNRELSHSNLAGLREVMLEDKSIYLIFEYAEHDFLQMIHHHTTTRSNIPLPVLKSMLWQLLNGVAYLHDNWVIHRDLKPANILVTSAGEVKIGDLGLARIYASPLQSLYASDKVVVTIWYRPPDLLMGARHYTTSVDIWSVGCIFGELVGLRPMFKGEEAKLEAPTAATNTGGQKKSSVPFQRDQLTRIFEVLGVPNRQRWPKLNLMPDHDRLDEFPNYPNELQKWWSIRAGRQASQLGFDLLSALLAYDPEKRITAHQSLLHPWWEEEPKVSKDSFPSNVYPLRRVSHDDSDPKLNAAAAKDSGKAGVASHVGSGINPRPNKKTRVS